MQRGAADEEGSGRGLAFRFCLSRRGGETYARLAGMALPERWDFVGTEARCYEILSDYLRFMFLRLERKNKVLVSDTGDFCAFNMGFVDESYEDIFACFTPNKVPGKQPWYLEGFAVAGAGWLGDRLSRSFHDLPQRARYLFKTEDVLYDVDQVPASDYAHILIGNVDRLPEAFLERELHDSDEEFAVVKRAFGMQEKDVRNDAFDALAKLLDADQRVFSA